MDENEKLLEFEQYEDEKKMIENEADFTKEKLLTFERFRDRRDLLTALLEDDKRYSVAEADLLIRNFMKGGEK